LHRWARRRTAAKGSRRERTRRGKWHNPERPRDFAARGQQLANGRSPRLERRTSVNRSPCGRRTSLPAARINASRLAVSIPAAGRRFHENSNCCALSSDELSQNPRAAFEVRSI
jgi:hypothetical protein